MNTAHPSPTLPSPPATALQATLGRLHKRLWRTTLVMLLLCSAISLMLNGFFLRGLGTKAVYSFAIGGCCWLISEAGTLLEAACSDLLRRARRIPASAGGYEHGWRGKITSTAACIVGGPLLGTHIGDAITGHRSAPLWELGVADSRLTVLLALLGSAVVISVISSMERLASARAQAEAAQRLASDTQLRLLQSQLEPHMLFNTLANLRVLIALDASRAQDMLDHLIAFLRATLQASRTGSHPLASEFDRTADYLALMAVRMGPRLRVQLDLPDALRTLPVPPLLLQPLVENSIQHGLEPQLEGGRVDVAARRDGHTLVLTVRDTGIGRSRAASMPPAVHLGSGHSTPHADRPAGGFGLAGTRERLQTLYGAQASLELTDASDADGGTLATVRLPLAALTAPGLANAPAAATTVPAPPAAAPAHPPATEPCPPPAP